MEPRYFHGVNPAYPAPKYPGSQFWPSMIFIFGVSYVWWQYVKLEWFHPYYKKPVAGVDEYWMEHQRARLWRMVSIFSENNRIIILYGLFDAHLL